MQICFKTELVQAGFVWLLKDLFHSCSYKQWHKSLSFRAPRAYKNSENSRGGSFPFLSQNRINNTLAVRSCLIYSCAVSRSKCQHGEYKSWTSHFANISVRCAYTQINLYQTYISVKKISCKVQNWFYGRFLSLTKSKCQTRILAVGVTKIQTFIKFAWFFFNRKYNQFRFRKNTCPFDVVVKRGAFTEQHRQSRIIWMPTLQNFDIS